ncbi:MAG: DNA polymerase I [Bacteroidaceae bacterium]|nr:DNA polymerase I [Bacteroidaceae bacterium]
MKKLFLLDAYALIYRAYYGFIRTPIKNSKGEDTSAIMGFVNTLEDVLKRENPEYIGVAFDPKGGTFRHEIYPQYKAQREETPEAIRFAVPIIKDILNAYNIPILEVPGFEADDVIGTLAWRFSSDEIGVFMMTPDKDYGQLVRPHVWMYKPDTKTKDFQVLGVKEICEKYGIENTSQVIDLLGLMGDASDNVPGCPGVGEVTAVKLIQQFGSIDNLLENTDQLKGAQKKKVEENKEQIKFSKFLVTIKTDVPIDVSLEELKREDINLKEVKEIFERLEFRALTQRVMEAHSGIVEPEKIFSTSKTLQKEKKHNSGMADLFGAPSTPTPQNPQFELFSEETVKEGEKTGVENSIFPSVGAETAEKTILRGLESTPHDYKLIETEEDIEEICQKFLSEKNLSLDTETTSTDAMSAELVGLSFSVKENEAYYVPIPSEREEALRILEKFKKVYADESILKIGQNLKYDITVLANYGIEVKGEMFDTMIAHYVLHPELRHNMDYLAEIYLNYKTIHIDELIGPRGKNQKSMRDLQPTEVYEYAAEDADITLQLYKVLNEELQREGLFDLFHNIEMPLMPVLARMEQNGVMIDTESLKQTSLDFSQKMDEIEKEIHEMAGEKFNISSPRQVGDILFGKLKIIEKAKKTKTGQYVTSEEVLQNLRSRHPIVEKILDYRGYKKLLSTYIDNLPELINPKTGHIHTSYNQAVTATGRLSSSNPNLQNIPIRDENGREVRKAFIPEPGSEFFSADYSQIELRIMAHLSGDANMIEAFVEGHDIHRATAAKVYKLPIEEVTSDQRRKAKTANFGIIYGITTFGLAERMQVSRAEAKELIDEYFATYPKVKEYMEKSIEMARQKGYTETLFGRRCYLPDINSHNATVRGFAERNAINAPIQGTAADIIKIAMVRIDKRMQAEGFRSKMILQVHDELNFSVLSEEKEALQRLVIEEMQSAYTMSVPLIADCGWGKNWLEAH